MDDLRNEACNHVRVEICDMTGLFYRSRGETKACLPADRLGQNQAAGQLGGLAVVAGGAMPVSAVFII